MMNILKKKKVYDIDTESYDNKSISSNSNESIVENNDRLNSSKIEKVHNYYLNNTNDITDKNKEYYKTESEVNLNIKSNEIERVNIEQKDVKRSDFYCELCKSNSSKDNFFILSCDHIYHIQCLADTHFEDIYKYPVIDNDYFSNRKCNICYKQLQLDEVMYLHGKYLKNTKDFIERHQNSIESLEYQSKKLKDELRVCYEYKHKLEQQREKSKQIVSILSTMIYN
jgi:hypothetical protein